MKAATLCSGVLLLVACTSPAYSAGGTPYETCINRTTTNPDWNQCGQEEIDRQEARLNAAWKKAYACFDTSTPTGTDARQSFLEEQRAWIKWKESACGFYYPHSSRDDSNGFAGREGQVLGAPKCKAQIISDRTKWLEGFTKDCQ